MRKLGIWIIAPLIALLVMAPAAEAFWGKGEVKIEDIAVKFAREVARGGYKIVKSDELQKWLKQGKAMLVVDTMPYEASYVKNHIPGAKQFLFPVKELKSMDAASQAKFRKLLGPDKSRLLVFYCGFTKCGRSHNGAMWAVKLGYRNVYRCPGGIKAWLQRGYKVNKVK